MQPFTTMTRCQGGNRGFSRYRTRGWAVTKRGENYKRALYACVAMNIVIKSSLTALLTKGSVVPRDRFDFMKHVHDLTEVQFTRMYRMSFDQFMSLRNDIQPMCKRRQRRNAYLARAVSTEVMLCVTLRILAGASYLDVSWPYGISTSTVYSVFHETLQALDETLSNIIFPIEEQHCVQEATRFKKMRRSPLNGIIGALDGIAIEIQQPSSKDVADARKYFNRKGFFALAVQAVVTADYRFTFVSATHSGSTHDSTALQASGLYTLIRSGRLPTWAMIVADDAYKNENHILTPYSGRALTPAQDAYNFYQSSCRIAVEQAFGILIHRWGIFWSAMRVSIANATKIIMVCCKLHNLLMADDSSDKFDAIPNHEDNHVSGYPVVHVQDALHHEPWISRARQRSRETNSVRDAISDRLQALGYVRRRTHL